MEVKWRPKSTENDKKTPKGNQRAAKWLKSEKKGVTKRRPEKVDKMDAKTG